MKSFQSNYVLRLFQPKAIIFGITLFNFIWLYWETLDSMAGRGILSAWYSTKEFPIAQLVLLISFFLLLIPRIWSYSISVLISGYFTISWILFEIKWISSPDYSFIEHIESIMSQFSGNPFEIWESQIIIATSIFALSVYHLVSKLFRSK